MKSNVKNKVAAQVLVVQNLDAGLRILDGMYGHKDAAACTQAVTGQLKGSKL